jgi:hypothetical protein
MNNRILTLAAAIALTCASPFALATPPDDPGSSQPSTAQPSSSRPVDQNGEVYQPGSSGPDSQTESSDRGRSAFSLLDRDGDNVLDRDELSHDDGAFREFDTLDADGDAKISAQEWAMYDADDTMIRPQ